MSGAGFLGLETAATARSLGVEVDIVSLEPSVPLLPKLGDVAASQLLAEHESRGVKAFVGVGVRQFIPDGARTTGVELTDGTVLPADVVLVAIGGRPNTEWLDTSGLTLADGVLCDEYSQAGPDVWAAGDVARWQHAGLGYTIRMEHRSNASEQAALVAKNILGGKAQYVPIPYFWTDQYGSKIQVAGFMPPHSDHRIVSGAPGEHSFVQEFTVSGHLVGALTWNSPRELSRYRRRLMDVFEENERRWDLGALGG